MKVDNLSDAELTALTELSRQTWEPGFDGAVLPGRWRTMKVAEAMRKISKTAAEVLQHDRGSLTYAVKRMREKPVDREREQTILEALDRGLELIEGHRLLLAEARRRMAIADARLRLSELEP